MRFKKYIHLEHLERSETEGILEILPCYVLPKLDGSNASIWHDGEKICFGSRNQELTESGKSFRGLREWIEANQLKLEKLFYYFDNNVILYGEWLVPHTIKGYVDNAWKQFYLFDIFSVLPMESGFQSHDIVEIVAKKFEIPFIPYVRSVSDSFDETLNNCTWLLKEDEKHEGLVIKRHDFINKYGRQVYAKYVPESLRKKAIERKEIFRVNIEEALANDFVNNHLLSKELSKVCEGMQPAHFHIPKFLGVLWHSFVTEEVWPILKKFRNPVIDFKKLKRSVEAKARDFILNKIEENTSD